MRTRTNLVAAVLAAGIGAAIVGKSLAFPSAVVLVVLTAWAIARFLQWRNGLRLRFAEARADASERPRGRRTIC
jgi:hypothetical protein